MDVFTAARRGDLERVRTLCEQDAGCVHATTMYGSTALYLAAEGGHLEVARYLLDHGAAVDHRDNCRRTALYVASSVGHTDVVSLLLRRGSDVNVIEWFAGTPLRTAASHGRDALVRVLLEHGRVDVDAATPLGYTACHTASSNGLPGVLRQLLEAGADPTLRAANGRTAIYFANERRHLECITILQEWEQAYLLWRARSLRVTALTSSRQKVNGFGHV